MSGCSRSQSDPLDDSASTVATERYKYETDRDLTGQGLSSANTREVVEHSGLIRNKR